MRRVLVGAVILAAIAGFQLNVANAATIGFDTGVSSIDPSGGPVTVPVTVTLDPEGAFGSILGHTIILDVQGAGGANVGTGLPTGVTLSGGTDLIPIFGPPETIQSPPAGGVADYSFADFSFAPTALPGGPNGVTNLFTFDVTVDPTAAPGDIVFALLADGAASVINVDFGPIGDVTPTSVATELFTIEGAAVPEPSSLMLLGLVGCAAGFAGRRRRNRK